MISSDAKHRLYLERVVGLMKSVSLLPIPGQDSSMIGGKFGVLSISPMTDSTGDPLSVGTNWIMSNAPAVSIGTMDRLKGTVDDRTVSCRRKISDRRERSRVICH